MTTIASARTAAALNAGVPGRIGPGHDPARSRATTRPAAIPVTRPPSTSSAPSRSAEPSSARRLAPTARWTAMAAARSDSRAIERASIVTAATASVAAVTCRSRAASVSTASCRMSAGERTIVLHGRPRSPPGIGTSASPGCRPPADGRNRLVTGRITASATAAVATTSATVTQRDGRMQDGIGMD